MGNIATTNQTNNQLSLNDVKIAEISYSHHNTSYGTYNSLLQVDDDTYALAYSGNGFDGYIQTFAISADGLTITAVSGGKQRHDSNQGLANSFIKVNGSTDMFALAYAGVGNDGIIKTFKINSSGSSVAQKNDKDDDLEFEDLYKVGTIAKIIKVIKMPNGKLTAIIQGKKSFKMKN